jgi:crotonobetainyl-CoA:carnitine CoA-transferase CaiB-like acyl-CoA transferase
MAGSLPGIKIIEFGDTDSGPLASMLPADFGVDAAGLSKR